MASRQRDRQIASSNFSSNLSRATSDYDMRVLAEIARNEGGQKAVDYYAKLRTTSSGLSEASIWCSRGVPLACEDADFTAGVDARARAAQQASGGGSGSSLCTAEEMTQALKDHNAAVNTQNCARADLGSSIACDRN